MEKEKKHFTWTPFYKELSEKLLDYKNKRQLLVNFIYAEDGLYQYSKALHLKNKQDKIFDIDPFSIFGLFNSGTKTKETRIEILKKIKTFFNITADVPSDFDAIPVLNYARSFFYDWNDLNNSCDKLWECYILFVENNSAKEFIELKGINNCPAESTMPLFWIKPNEYIALDSNNRSYLKSNGLNADNINNYDDYVVLLNQLKQKISNKEIAEKNIIEFSYNAWFFKDNPQGASSMTNEKLTEYKELLLENYNLILHGAPGTGKTHLAKEIAEAMNAEVAFCQFHPSYDYTDFVEGLRPVSSDDSGQIGFKRTDGVFKEFCRKALKSQTEKTVVDNFEGAWNKLVDVLNENDYIEVPLLSNKGSIKIELNEYGTGLANRTYENDEYKKDSWISGKSKFFSKEQLYNIYKGLPGVPAGGHDNYRKAIVNYMKQNLELKDYFEGSVNEDESQKPFVFIIDEINRGELSKIFGELFFLIDPGYRGLDENGKPKGLVTTQYQNLVEDTDPFKKGFFVPDNVYIIGTMNDIDRSVESMDFAMRRRFIFKEVTAEESAENMNLPDEAKETMKKINDRISTEGLGSAYHIGGAYFLNVTDFDKLWKLKLSSLVKEYLRGLDDDDLKYKRIEDAYFNRNQDGAE